MYEASRQALPPVRLLCLAIAATGAAPFANAAFIEDSKATLTTTNIYLNRDFREGTGQNKRDQKPASTQPGQPAQQKPSDPVGDLIDIFGKKKK